MTGVPIAHPGGGLIGSREDVVERFLDDVPSFNTFARVVDRLESALNELGFDGFYFATARREVWPNPKSDEAIFVARGPLRLKAYEVLYLWKGHRDVDPVLPELARRNSPFMSRQIYDNLPLTAKQKDLVALTRKFGLHYDLNIPMHTPRRIQVVGCFILGDDPQIETRTLDLQPVLEKLAFAFALSVNDFIDLDMLKLPNTSLSIREHECLTLIAGGQTNAEIAEHLNISERTAKFHVTNIMHKLGARSRSQAIAIAARANFLTN